MPSAAVLGRPIAHSLSPALHAAAYRALGWDGWRYDRIETGEAGLAGVLERENDRIGFSLTMPLKAEVLRLAAARGWRAERTAARTGAGNTLVRFPDGVLIANTDVAGIDTALGLAGADWDSATFADVLGGGATAASALAACAGRGIGLLRAFVREPARASAVRAAAEGMGVAVEVHRLQEWNPAESRIVVSTLPGAAADAYATAVREVPPGAALLNAAYSHGLSPLAVAWERAGGRAARGEQMLIGQAVEQFALFARAAVDTGQHPAPLPADLRDRVAAAMTDAIRTQP